VDGEDDDTRHELELLRPRLDQANAACRDIPQLEKELAALTEPAHSDHKRDTSAYRDATHERARDVRARLETARAKMPERHRLREVEAQLLVKLERERVALERRGIRRNVIPLLEGVQPAASCPIRWNEMVGDGNERRCTHCHRTVYDISLLDAAEAERLLASARSPSGKFSRRTDGTLLADDCPLGEQRQEFWRRVAVPVFGLLLFALAAAIAFAALRPHPASSATVETPSQKTAPLPTPSATPPAGLSLPLPAKILIEDSNVGLGGSESAAATLTSEADHYAFSIRCVVNFGTANHAGTVAIAPVEAFLHAVNAHTLDPDQKAAFCTHTDDYPKVNVEVTSAAGRTVRLRIANCSRQWSADGVILSAEPLSQDPFATHHASINKAYGELLEALGERACSDEANAADRALRTPPPKGRKSQKPLPSGGIAPF
jgi:hypothetical protein